MRSSKLCLILSLLFPALVTAEPEELLPQKHSATSVIHECIPLWSIDTTPEGAIAETGISNSTAGLEVDIRTDVSGAAWEASYSQAGGTIQAITTIDTYEAPSANSMRIGECVTGSGTYQLMFLNSVYSVSGAKSIVGRIRDSSSPTFADKWFKININVVDLQDFKDAMDERLGNYDGPTNAEMDAGHTSILEDITDLTDGTSPVHVVGQTLATGTCDSGTTATCVDEARDEADTDYWVGSRFVTSAGSAAFQPRCVTAFTPGSPATITFAPVTTQAISTDAYSLVADPVCERVATAQSDLDLLTGTDGATLATTQGNYAPAKAGDSMDLVTDAIDDGSINAAQTELASATDLAAAQGDLDTLTAGVTVTAVSVAGLADFFDTDSGTTYGAAIGGSVVKEIADNAGGSALTVEDIRAEMDSNSTQLAAIVADTNALRRTIAVFDTTIAAYTANDDFTITAGPADDDAIKGCMAMVTDQGDPTQIAYFGIAGYTASSKTIAGDEDPAVFTYANGDSVTISCFGVTTEFMNRSEVIGAGNAGDLWRGN